MNTNEASSNYHWRLERNEMNTVQSKKSAPKVPQLLDTECISHRKNREAKHRTSLQPRKYPIQNSPRSSAVVFSPTRKHTSFIMPFFEPQPTEVMTLDNIQFSFNTPKQTTSCSIYSNHTKPVPCFPTLPMRLEDLDRGVNFALLPRPSLKPRMKRESKEVTTFKHTHGTLLSHVDSNV
ncbi:hypothetical protein HJC23_009558 [Cyclotella cryptica]|uniref:Uncharacterized protein n=1 Tax=Cyclotella cryptica TaxID=29204 RepID=A0ABD3PH65_9STRA